MTLETIPFDPAEFLETPEDQAEFIKSAVETGDPSHISKALGVVARARGMSQIARDAGVTREALYKALSDKGDPKLSTFMGVFKALGLKITVEPINDNYGTSSTVLKRG